MVKWRFSLAVAALAGILTFCFGMLQQARLETLFFRTAVSVFVFSMTGLIIGILLDRFFRHLLTQYQVKGTQVDVTADESLSPEAPYSSSEFIPLSSENAERIFQPKN